MEAAVISWFVQNVVGILGILVGGFIAYHVYYLSERLNFKDKLVHRDQVQQRANSISKIKYGRKVELINTKKYYTHYPEDNSESGGGYTYLGANLKTAAFYGVEFFCSMPIAVYEDSDGMYHLKSSGEQKEKIVFPVGIVPYEWIEYVDERGDETSYRPQFFVNFKGAEHSPYQKIVYYEKSPVYHEGSDPPDWEYRQIDVVT